jgi:hypothetical protein
VDGWRNGWMMDGGIDRRVDGWMDDRRVDG